MSVLQVEHGGEHYIHLQRRALGGLSARDIEDLSRLIPIFLDIKAKHRRNFVIQKAKQLRDLDRAQQKAVRQDRA